MTPRAVRRSVDAMARRAGEEAREQATTAVIVCGCVYQARGPSARPPGPQAKPCAGEEARERATTALIVCVPGRPGRDSRGTQLPTVLARGSAKMDRASASHRSLGLAIDFQGDEALADVAERLVVFGGSAGQRGWPSPPQRGPPPALPPPIVTREEAEESSRRASQSRPPIDYSWQDERAHGIQYRTTRMVEQERKHAHALGDEAACRLYQRLALAAVMSDRIGERSSMWELPGDVHQHVAAWFEAVPVHPLTICRYREEGWAWHLAWVRQARVSHLYRSVALSRSESYVPGLGASRVQSLQSERERRSVSACLQQLTERNDPETARAALLCVQQLLQAVLNKPSSQRVRRLRRSNAALQRRLLCADAGEALLVAVGFEPCTDSVSPSRDEQQRTSYSNSPGATDREEEESWFVLPPSLAAPFLQMSLQTISEHADAIATKGSR